MTDTQQQASSEKTDVKFSDFGLVAKIQKALDDLGYHSPTPIQQKAIPEIMAGKDVMGAAQTGTGKTAGYSLPVLQELLYFENTSVSPARHPVRALILVPTRELADQVYEDVLKYAKYTNLRTVVVYGGVDMAPQTEALRAGCEVLIATPGRLLDHVQQRNVTLNQAHTLVLDEADRMLDMGFLPDLQRIVQLLPQTNRQNLLFSATFSDEIRRLADNFLNDPVVIEVSRKNATADNVSQTIYRVDEDDKSDAVEYLIRQRADKQILVFMNTRVGASRLVSRLSRKQIKATAIHGNRTQAERMASLEAFKQGEVHVLVATDVAARGLHIDELPCVINYDLPFMSEDYVHRIGRTGRAGASGEAISLYSDKDEKFLAEIEKLIKKKFEIIDLTEFKAVKQKRFSRRFQDDEEETFERHSDRDIFKQLPLSDDPWFDRPYEPETGEVVSSHKTEKVVKKSAGKPLAFLLGGSIKDKDA